MLKFGKRPQPLSAAWGAGRVGTLGAQARLFSGECICYLLIVGADIDELCTEHPDVVFKHYAACAALTERALWASTAVQGPVSLRGWQLAIKTHLLAQDDRRICFVVDETGGAGKTVLAKHLMHTYRTFYCTGGKSNDLAYSYKDPRAEIAILDLSRNPDDKDFHPYTFAEQLKNGLFSSGKYASRLKTITPPKVIWFANQMPDRSKLSDDRYCVHTVDKNKSDMKLVDEAPPLPPPFDLQEIIDEFVL